MIVMHSEVPLEPDSRDEAIELLKGLARDSRAEPGTIDYRVTVDLEDPNVARIIEQYEDAEAAASHESSEHLAAFLEEFEPYLAGYSELTRFEVTSKTTREGP